MDRLHQHQPPSGLSAGSSSGAAALSRHAAAEAHREYFRHVGLQLRAGVTVHHLCDDFRPAHRLSGQRVWRRGNTRLRRGDTTIYTSANGARGMQDRLRSSGVSHSIAAAGMTRLSLAQASERWHLLVPPAVHGEVEKRFLRVSDAPLVKRYLQGHFAPFGECHPARAISLLRSRKKPKWVDNFYQSDTGYASMAGVFQPTTCGKTRDRSRGSHEPNSVIDDDPAL